MLARVTSVLSGVTGWALFLRVVTILFMIMAVARIIPVRSRRGGRRDSRHLGLPLWGAGLVACVMVIGGVAYAFGHVPPRIVENAASGRRAAVRRRQRRGAPYVGVYEPGEFASYLNVTRFGEAAGYQPRIVLYYSAWNTPFQAAFAATARSHGAMPFVDLEPRGIRVSAIARGRYDAYLRSYATQVRAYGHPVVLSFAPEANGNWDKWGWTHTSPKTWVAAWRHIVDVFRQQRVTNVIWAWVMNRSTGATGPLRDYWPGSSYVTWVGIDGYYFKRGQTFQHIFAPTITAIRKFTAKPIILSEVGIGQVAGQAATLPDLFAGIRRYHLIGLVWFDAAQHGGLYKQDWRLEGHSAALAAFRRGVASLTRSSG